MARRPPRLPNSPAAAAFGLPPTGRCGGQRDRCGQQPTGDPGRRPTPGVGIEPADTAARAADRARALAAIVSSVDVLDYTEATAAHHARLIAHVKRSGTPRGAHDLIIAAHASETGRTVITNDAQARFGNLPNVLADKP